MAVIGQLVDAFEVDATSLDNAMEELHEATLKLKEAILEYEAFEIADREVDGERV